MDTKPTYRELELRIQELEKRERETFYRDIFEKNRAVQLLIDPDTGSIVEANPAACNFYKYSYEEITALKIWDINTLEESQIRKEMAKVLQVEKNIFEFRHRLSCGDIRNVMIHSCPVKTNGKNLLYSIIFDITERKRTEEKLKESEARLKEAERTGRIAHVEIGMESANILWGDMMYELYERDPVLGPPDYEEIMASFPPEDARRLDECVQNAIHENQPYSLDLQVNLPGGKTRYHHAIGTPVTDEEGRVVKITGTVQDITERKLAEEKLRKSEALYRTLTKNFPNGALFLFDREYRYLAANGKAFARAGLNADEVVGKTVWEVFPELWHYLKPHHEAVLRGEETFYEVEFRGRLYSNQMVPVFDEEHTVTMAIVIVWDITREKQDKAERERLYAAIEQTPESIVITDPDATIQYVNPAFEKVTGYLREEALGRSPAILKSNEHDVDFYRELWQTISEGNTWKGVFVNKKKDGTLYHEDAIISPVFDDIGQIVNYVAVKRDITEELRMEEKMRQAHKMEAIGTLASGIAHDFNNILFPIIGYTEMVLESLDTRDIDPRILKEILKAAYRARDLVRQILTFGRKSGTDRNPLKLKPVVKEAMKLIRSTIPTTIDIHSNINDTAMVMADVTQVQQILLNLCTNAYQAMYDTGGEIYVTLKETEIEAGFAENHPDVSPGWYVCISVKDTGGGVDKSILNKIFEPYFTTKEKGKGTGLGLAVVDGIVKDHGGFITVENKPGIGCGFHIYFPAIESKPEKKEENVIPIYPTGTESILFVDDEPYIAEMIQMVLGKLGYKITTVHSSPEALELFRKTPEQFDLLFTDMTMPKMTGLILAKEVKKIRKDIPVIICTGFSEKINEEKCKILGIQGFVMKPVVTKDMAVTVRNVLDKSQNRKK